MSLSELPVLPPIFRSIEPFVKLAKQYEKRDIVVCFWSLYRAVQEGLKLKDASKSAADFLSSMIVLLEKIKKSNPYNEGISMDTVAQAHIEEQTEQLFGFADSQDSAGVFNVNVVKAFYTTGYLMDVLSVFAELDDQAKSIKKYAKWRATYIHNCLKNGKVPMPGNGSTQSAAEYDRLESYNVNSFVHSVVAEKTEEPVVDRNKKPISKVVVANPVEPAISTNVNSSFDEVMATNNLFSSPSVLHVDLPVSYDPSPDIDLDDFVEAKKFIKYAISALDYEDGRACVENLLKAIAVLQKR